MVDVVNNSTPYLSDDDIKAMAVYLKSLAFTATEAAFAYNDATTVALQTGQGISPGGRLYAANCLSCHGSDGKGFSPYLPRLAGNPTVLDADPSSLINITLNGSAPLVVKGNPDAYPMPQFRLQLNDPQIADVLTFVRGGWGNQEAAIDSAAVASLRRSTDPASDRVTILKMR
jgi:mono/diheme cytochrome c family protein